MKKVIITGTGRAGTSFLVHLFTKLGMDTGFTLQQCQSQLSRTCNAGLEKPIDANHYILKSPHYAPIIDQIIDRDDIKHIIIPFRGLVDSSKSRERNNKAAGGLWFANNLEEQLIFNSNLFYNVMYHTIKSKIPYTLVLFPDFVKDKSILYDNLKWLFDEYKVSYIEYCKAMDSLIDLKKIHFDNGN